MYKYLFVVAFAATFGVSPIFASETPLTLSKAIEKTLSNNPQLKQFELKKKQLSTSQEVGKLRPALNLDLEVENFEGSGNFEGFDSAEQVLALSSVIEMGGKRRSRVKVAESLIEQFDLDQELQTIDLLGNLTRLFISTISISEKIILAEQSVRLHTKLLQTVQNRVDKGIAQEADLMRSRSALIEAKIKLEGLQNKLAINNSALAKYWGERKPEFKTVSGNLYAFDKVLTFDELFLQVENSPAIQRYASEARLKKAELQLAKTSNRSDITWNFGVRKFEETDDKALVAGVSVPLFSSRRNRFGAQSAQYALDAAELNRESALLLLHQKLFSAYNQRQQAITTEEKIRLEVIPALEKAATLTLEGYERGRFTYQDVVSAQRELISAKLIQVEKATIAFLNQSTIEQLIAKPLSD